MDLEKKIQSKRHEELLVALKKVSASISEIKKTDGSNVELVTALSAQAQLMKEMIGEIKKIQQPPVKKDNSVQLLSDSITSMAGKMISGLAEISSKIVQEGPVEWEHVITRRDFDGRVSAIVSKPKK